MSGETAPAEGAERTRRYRARRACGAFVVPVLADSGLIASLATLGLLSPEMTADRDAVAEALGSLVKHVAVLVENSPTEARRALGSPQSPCAEPAELPGSVTMPELGSRLAAAIARRLAGGA